MASIFPLGRLVRCLTALCLLAAVLAGCGGGGGGGLDAVSVGSRLSVFGLRGEKPNNPKNRSDELVMVDGAAVRADQDNAGASVETGLASMSISFGGFGFKGPLGGGVSVFGETLDIIELDAFGAVTTRWERHLDGKGGAEDSFKADVETSRNSTVFQTDAGRLTLRNMDGADGSGLTYATYGYWNAEFATFDRLVAFTVADQNAGTTIPAAGMATYQGGMTGLYSAGFGAANQAAAGDVSLTADFDSKSVSGEITGITAGAESLRDVALQVTALTGSTFSGSAATLPAGAGQTGPEMSGDYSGGLYGPLAPEAVGAFALTGAGGEALVGGFAVQQ